MRAKFLIALLGALFVLTTPAHAQDTSKKVFKIGWAQDPQAVRAAELSRIQGVNAFMRVVKAVELALIGVGLGLAISGDLVDTPVLTGVGLGLMGQATTMLTLDMFAAERALDYEAMLRRLPGP